ncbi:sensor histidine kinase [uncultured Kordia sp.]|uniref:sensor histidine kinase n=1 Tax=uncultured Kordia sp. TaxID=507699 RepID=UPI0026276DEB|nr:histidine kinase [uncultured Kordia sp.]
MTCSSQKQQKHQENRYICDMEIKKHWKYHVILGIALLLLEWLEDYTINGMKGLMTNFSGEYQGLLLTFYACSIAIYFLNFFVIAPKLLSKKRLIPFILAVFGMILLFAGLRYLTQEVILFEITGQHNYHNKSRELIYYVFDNSYYAIKPILYSTIVFLVLQYNENKDKLFQLKLEHNKGEISFLKSQISPHFLFNTLNTFYSELIDKQPNTAKDIHRLSELLRYVTYESSQDFMPLAKELKFIEDYMYFYKIRFEDQLFVDFSVEGEVGDKQVPSLVLIHFVENLFKHGIVNDENHPAEIKVTIEDHFLQLTTKNKVLLSDKYMDAGVGAENVQKRLKAIFTDEFEVNYNNENGVFQAYLKLPL